MHSPSSRLCIWLLNWGSSCPHKHGKTGWLASPKLQHPRQGWLSPPLPSRSPPAALPPIIRPGLLLGQCCPSVKGNLPESHQANLQRSIQVWVPLEGQGEAAVSG